MPLIDSPKYMCVGCGACAYTCPKQCIEYGDNILGQYTPVIDYNKCINCNLCERVCPIYSNERIEQIYSYNEITGNYISCYKGFDERFRKTSASGGLLTSVLYELLESNEIDFAVCVRNESKEKISFFQYDFTSNKNELIKNSKSVYYPLELSDVLRYIKHNEGVYALVTLPCQAKAIRTIQRKDSLLKKRIKYLLGLVCGGMPGKAMIEYIAEDNGIKINDVLKISFREKNINDFNRHYSVTLSVDKSLTIRSRFPEEAFGFSFLNKLFHYKGCNVCNDIFAEYADAAFMDAWLPEHRDDKLGTSIAIIRNYNLHAVLTPLFNNNPHCQQVSIDVPIAAQNTVGLVQRKKKQAYFKLNLYRKLGYITPTAENINFSVIEKLKFLVRSYQELLIQNKSKKEWNRFKHSEISFQQFNRKIKRYVKLIKRI